MLNKVKIISAISLAALVASCSKGSSNGDSAKVTNANTSETQQDKNEVKETFSSYFALSSKNLLKCDLSSKTGTFSSCDISAATGLTDPRDLAIVDKSIYIVDRGSKDIKPSIQLCKIGEEDKVTECVNSNAQLPGKNPNEANAIAYHDGALYITFVGANYNTSGVYKYKLNADGTLAAPVNIGAREFYPIGAAFFGKKIIVSNWAKNTGITYCSFDDAANISCDKNSITPTDGSTNKDLNGYLGRDISFTQDNKFALLNSGENLLTCSISAEGIIDAKSCAKNEVSGVVNLISDYAILASEKGLNKCKVVEGKISKADCTETIPVVTATVKKEQTDSNKAAISTEIKEEVKEFSFSNLKFVAPTVIKSEVPPVKKEPKKI